VPGNSALPLWKMPQASSNPLLFCQTAPVTPRQGVYRGPLLGAQGKPFCKITFPDLMEAIHRWKSGLLLGGKAQPLK